MKCQFATPESDLLLKSIIKMITDIVSFRMSPSTIYTEYNTTLHSQDSQEQSDSRPALS